MDEKKIDYCQIEIKCECCSQQNPRCDNCDEYLGINDLFTCDEKGHICYDCHQSMIEEEIAKKELGR